MDETTLLGLTAFGFVGCLAYFVLQLFGGSQDEQKLRSRLKTPDAPSPTGRNPAPGASASFLTRFGQAAARPFMPKQRESIS